MVFRSPYALYANEARYLRGYGPDDFVSVADLEGLGYVTEGEVGVLIGDAIADINNNGGGDAPAVRAIVDEVPARHNHPPDREGRAGGPWGPGRGTP